LSNPSLSSALTWVMVVAKSEAQRSQNIPNSEQP
jgi:hypothetical protein